MLQVERRSIPVSHTKNKRDKECCNSKDAQYSHTIEKEGEKRCLNFISVSSPSFDVIVLKKNKHNIVELI
jgi:hypothetical protein